MDFEPSAKCRELSERLEAFMAEKVLPAEPVWAEQMAASGDGHHHAQVVEDLKAEARARGLWNLFLPHATEWTEGLSNLDYAPLAEISGRSHLAPEALNCAAPDTGNMEVLTMFGTDEQKEQWLRPLLEGEIRSCFAMTEPDVASSDATNIALRIETDGDDYVLNGRKWWISGAARDALQDRHRHGQDRPRRPPPPPAEPGAGPPRHPRPDRRAGPHGVRLHRPGGPLRAVLRGRAGAPVATCIGEEGGGFAIAQARLGPGRIHHCMRAIGVAERALEAMCRRVTSRTAFGKPLSDQGVIQEWIADSRMDIEQARLLVLKTAWLMDTVGNKGARIEVSAIKVAVPNMALRVVDRAIQAHGGGGVGARLRPGLHVRRTCAPCAWPTVPTRSTGCSWPSGRSGSTSPPDRPRSSEATTTADHADDGEDDHDDQDDEQ